MAKRRILVGGITGGLGSALAYRLHESGAFVGGFSKSAENGEVDGIWQRRAEATDAAAMDRVFQDFAAEAGGIDGYVHAIGSVFIKPGHLTSDEEFDEVLQTNLYSAFYATRSALKVMRKAKGGSIVLVSSVAARAGLSNHEAIASAKGGIEGLVRSTSATVASAGIRINAIAPGLVESKATAMMTSNDQARAFSAKMHPLGRIGQSDEVASLAQWFLSDEASWVTGQIWSMDGGMGTIVPKPRA